MNGSKYDTPEIRAAVEQLKRAEANAHKDAWRCPHCHRADTLNVAIAEGRLIRAIRAEFPDDPGNEAA